MITITRSERYQSEISSFLERSSSSMTLLLYSSEARRIAKQFVNKITISLADSQISSGNQKTYKIEKL